MKNLRIDSEIGQAIETELIKVCRLHGEFREGKRSLKSRNQAIGHCKRRIETWLTDGLASGTDSLSKLCENLLNEFECLCAFTKVKGMEPTNTLAERNLRKIVVWRKKSYGTRSDRGKRFVERITSITQTLRRQGKNVLSFIQEAVICHFSHEKPPIICPDLGF
ncbi:MAG: hypothetical protein K1060chlam1_00873 [Candidatus Anoxychlamydiales bacterium]|nr:hypothetical protein [Candidatus Anoxychlamydiales bacterium]